MEALQGEIACFYAKNNRDGPPNANQLISRDVSRCGRAVCILQVHPPTSPYPLSIEAEPIFQRTLPEVTS